MRPECINVRALSANEGSGTAGWPLVEPLACFPKDEDDIAQNSFDMQRIMSYAAVLSAAFERFPLARIIHEGTESGSLGGVCALRMVVAA